jgi:hypothetical protein
MAGTGTLAVTAVPCPGCDVTVTVPPTASMRSRMLASPAPPACRRVRREAAAVVVDVQPADRAVPLDADGDRGGPGVLPGVLQRLERHEEQRLLDARRQPPDVGARHPDRHRAADHRGAQGGDQAVGLERPWVDPPREVRQRRDGLARRARLAVEQGDRPLRGAGGQALGQAQVHGERHEVLLRAVVHVALEPAALRVLRGDQPVP